MSQPPDPSITPPDPPPLRVTAQPLGVTPLNVLPYTVPSTNARPGVVTAIGVTSIIIGSLSMLMGLFSAFMTLGLFIASSAGFAMNTAAVADFAGPAGYSKMDRDVIVPAFNLKQKLTLPQREHLHYFLSDVGTRYVPAVPVVSPTNDPVADYEAKNITNGGAGVEGGAWFDLPMGRLTLTDSDAAMKLSSDGSTIARSATRQMANPANPSQLSPAEVAAMVNRVQESSPLNPAQSVALTTELQNNAGALIAVPKDMPVLMGQVLSVTNTPAGVQVVFPQATMTLAPGGSVATSSAMSFGGGAAAGGGGGGSPRVAGAAAVTLIIESLLSMGLAIYLLVIGIMTLRNHPAAARLHKIYAWLKIVLTAVAAVALWRLITTAGGPPTWAWLSSLTLLLASALYPIVLLFVLPARSIRAFYAVEHVR